MPDLLTGLEPEAGDPGEPFFQQDFDFQPGEELAGADVRASAEGDLLLHRAVEVDLERAT